MKRRGFSLWEMTTVLAGVGILLALFVPVFGRERPPASLQQCQSNLRHIGLAMLIYNRDYDEKFAIVSSNRLGWADLIQPYMNSRSEFYCPVLRSSRRAKTSDYFYNSRLAGESYNYAQSKSKTNLPYPEWTIMVGDGTAARPTNSSLRALPASWRNNPKSPATRHEGMANYVFVDGHVKELSADLIDDGERRKAESGFSFALR